MGVIGCTLVNTEPTISKAYTAADQAGEMPTTTFAPEDTFYAVVEVQNAPSDMMTRIVWGAGDVEGLTPNSEIQQGELPGSGRLIFQLSNVGGSWPTGDYAADLFLDDEYVQTLTFTVEDAPSE